jgi:photosystem II stability/assembly factor-like uncharacterized protein
MMSRVLALIAVLGICAESVAQDWQPIGPWGGFDIVLKAPDPGGQRVYALGNAGLFRSDDRGANWRRLVLPGNGKFAYGESRFDVRRDDPDRVLAIAFGSQSVWQSRDGGDSWSQVYSIDPTVYAYANAVALGQGDTDALSIFTTHPRLGEEVPPVVLWMHSNDGGATLATETLATPSECGAIGAQYQGVAASAYDRSGSDRLYYSEEFRCRDLSVGGNAVFHLKFVEDGVVQPLASVSMLSIPLSQPTHADIRQVGSRIFWRKGFTLTRVDIGGGQLPLEGYARSIFADEAGIVLGTTDGLLASDDGGVSWTALDDGDFNQGIAQILAFSSTRFSDGDLLASNRFGVFRKQAAQPWRFQSEGLSGLMVRSIVVESAGQRLWASTAGSAATYHGSQPGSNFFRSGDAGATWDSFAIDSMPYELHRIVVDPDTLAEPSQTVLYASGTICQTCSVQNMNRYGVFKSVDGGAGWEVTNVGMGPTQRDITRAIAADFLSASVTTRTVMTLPRSGFIGVYRSLDSAASWAPASAGLPGPAPATQTPVALELISSPVLPGVFLLGTRIQWTPGFKDYPTLPAGVFRTTNNGASWQHISNGLPLIAPGGSATGVLRLAAHPTDPLRLWAVTYERDSFTGETENRVFRTSNGGELWFESSAGLPPATWWAIAVERSRPEYVYVAGTAGVFVSPDGGGNWQQLGSLPIDLNAALAVNDAGVFAGGIFGVHRISRPDLGDPIFCSGFEPEPACGP